MLIFIFLLFALPVFAEDAPNFDLPTRESQISLDSLKGEVIYLDFWASWCKPCRETFPWMNEIREVYENRGLKVVAVNLDRSRDLADKFLAEHPANFTIAFDSEGKTAESYKVAAMPTAFIIDRSGKIIARHEGFHDKDRDKLLGLLEQALSDTSNSGVTP